MSVPRIQRTYRKNKEKPPTIFARFYCVCVLELRLNCDSIFIDLIKRRLLLLPLKVGGARFPIDEYTFFCCCSPGGY